MCDYYTSYKYSKVRKILEDPTRTKAQTDSETKRACALAGSNSVCVRGDEYIYVSRYLFQPPTSPTLPDPPRATLCLRTTLALRSRRLCSRGLLRQPIALRARLDAIETHLDNSAYFAGESVRAAYAAVAAQMGAGTVAEVMDRADALWREREVRRKKEEDEEDAEEGDERSDDGE